MAEKTWFAWNCGAAAPAGEAEGRAVEAAEQQQALFGLAQAGEQGAEGRLAAAGAALEQHAVTWPKRPAEQQRDVQRRGWAGEHGDGQQELDDSEQRAEAPAQAERLDRAGLEHARE